MRNLGVIMPGCVVQQTGISCLRKMNMMTFAVVQSITFLPSLTMFYFKILMLKLNTYLVIILSSVGGKLKQHSEIDTASHSRELYFFFILLKNILLKKILLKN